MWTTCFIIFYFNRCGIPFFFRIILICVRVILSIVSYLLFMYNSTIIFVCVIFYWILFIPENSFLCKFLTIELNIDSDELSCYMLEEPCVTIISTDFILYESNYFDKLLLAWYWMLICLLLISLVVTFLSCFFIDEVYPISDWCHIINSDCIHLIVIGWWY